MDPYEALAFTGTSDSLAGSGIPRPGHPQTAAPHCVGPVSRGPRHLQELDYHASRQLKRELIVQLASSEWVDKGHNLQLTGAVTPVKPTADARWAKQLDGEITA